MSQIDELKTQARQLLEEVNKSGEKNVPSRDCLLLNKITFSSQSSFKNRLYQLRQKAISLKFASV